MKRVIGGSLLAILYSCFWAWFVVTRWRYFTSWWAFKDLLHSERLYITIPEIVIIYSVSIWLIYSGYKSIHKVRNTDAENSIDKEQLR